MRMRKKKNTVILVLCGVIVLVILFAMNTNSIETVVTNNRHHTYNVRNFSKYKIKYDANFFKKKDTKTIVVWTGNFVLDSWLEKTQVHMNTCPASCDITSKKSEARSADAVLFDLHFLWKYHGIVGTIYNYVDVLPKTRKPEQVWVLLSGEPTSKIYGILDQNLEFNWTISHRRESDIRLFSTWRKKSIYQLGSNAARNMIENIFETKTKFMVTAVSNCYAQTKRYRIIWELEKYITIDKFGRCYGERVQNEDLFKEYKFYLAIENTLCRDYITEKYWLALNRNQIPVIATIKYNTELLPPGSFINVYDFDSIKSLTDHLIKIGNNETLYNSFFEWKRYYTPEVDVICRLCIELHANRSAQSLVDAEGWIRDDICNKSTAWALISEVFDSWLFRFGLV